MTLPHNWLASAGEVLTLFVIPWGGGIPAGVILAQKKELAWPLVTAVYFISDVILAIIFEPLMHVFIYASKRSAFLTRFVQNYRAYMARTGFKVSEGLSPLRLILISFGIDPMTGRSAAKAVGHGFISGWAIAITGDMFFFLLIMASTLWLNNILGNGTAAALIVMFAMIAVPAVIKRLKQALSK